jgi:ribosomal protein S18 acetylase RimI-like enzyme
VVDQTDINMDDPLRGTADADTLDHAAWASLTGPHRRFAETHGQAARYPVDVSPFVAVAPDHDERVWDDLAALVGPGGTAPLTAAMGAAPAGWVTVARGEGVQMIGTGLEVAADADLIELGSADVPDMLELIARTRPGPFLPRTIELGRYLGIRSGGTLVAMAGERLHPPGWTEISAVCTDAAHRGEGLATRLVRAVGAGIKGRGEKPFLHVVATNTNAIRLYEQLGFVVRRRNTFRAVRVPDL